MWIPKSGISHQRCDITTRCDITSIVVISHPRCDITTNRCDITSDVIYRQFGIIAVETHQNASRTNLRRQLQLSDRCVEFCRREVLESCSPTPFMIELIVDRIPTTHATL